MNTKHPTLTLTSLGLAVLFTAACSHGPTRYEPEVGNASSVVADDGVIYPIPPQNTQLRMKLVSLPEPKKHLFHVRMYFKQVRSGQQAKIDPMAQTLVLPAGEGELHRTRVYANRKAKPMIDLSGREKQIVELVYALPSGGDAFPYLEVRWTISYGKGSTETQTTRFNRDVKQIKEGVAQKQALEGDFPYGDALGDWNPMWIDNDFGWWDGLP